MTALATLYDLPPEMAALADVDETPDERLAQLQAAYAEHLAGVEAADRVAAIEGQVMRMGLVQKSLKADKALLEAHLAETQAKLESVTSRMLSLSKWTHMLMVQEGIGKVKTAFVSIWTQRNASSVEIDDESRVPDRFKRATIVCPVSMVPEALRELVTKTEVSKTLLHEAMEKDGEVIDGATLVTDRTHLRVQ